MLMKMQPSNNLSDPTEVPGGRPNISSLVEASNNRVLAAFLESLMRMPYDNFEALIGQLLVGVGYKSVQVSARGPDGGVDLTAEATVRLGSVRVLVQVKRHRRNIPVEIIRELRGCLLPGDHGVVITTA